MTTTPLTATWSEVENLVAAEAMLVAGWTDALTHGQTARFVAALIENAVGFEPRLGLAMDVCDRHGCSVFVDEDARDDGRLYCSDAHRDADSEDAHERRTARLAADRAWVA